MNNDNIKIKKTKKLLRRIIKVVLLVFIFYFTLAFLVFYYFKDDISKSILLGINSRIKGELSFSDISLALLKHFPDITVDIHDVTLKENAKSDDTTSVLICSFKDVYCSLDIVDLISKKISIPKVSVEDGYLNLIVYPDSSTNFGNMLGIKDPKKSAQPNLKDKTIVAKSTSPGDKIKAGGNNSSGQIKDKPATQNKKSTNSGKTEAKKNKPTSKNKKNKAFDFDLAIDRIAFSDVKINAKNYLTSNKFNISVKEFDAKLNISKKNISAGLILDLTIDSMVVKDKLILSNKNLFIDSRVHINRDAGFVKIHESELAFDEAEFNLKGIFDSKNEGNVNLSITGEKELNGSFLSLFLRKDGIDNLKEGTAFFDASVKGKIYTEMPLLEMKFSLSDVSVVNPVTRRLIKNLNLKGSFNSGQKNDFSESLLVIDTLHANLSKRGSIRFSGKVRNFAAPETDINLFLNADVTGLDHLFKTGVDSLKGRIKINERYRGKIAEGKKILTDLNYSTITFQDFGISIPGKIKLDKVNGTISRKNDIYLIKDLRVISADTDFLLNGEINNLQYLFFGVEKEIDIELSVISPVFNTNFFVFNPYIKRNFPYRIIEGDLSVSAKTTTTKLSKFISFPEIDFTINKADFILENFLPRAIIKSGKFLISEDKKEFRLKFDKLKTGFLNGAFNFSADYSYSYYKPYYIKMTTDFDEIRLSNFFKTDKNTLPELLKGSLSGSFDAEFQVGFDSIKVKFISLKKADLLYKYSKDTIRTKNLNLDFKNISFNPKNNRNALATLSTTGKVNVNVIKSNQFNLSNLIFDLNVTKGAYELVSNQARLFGENAKGVTQWRWKPFAKVPEFGLKYDIETFYAEKMLASYMEKEMITGPLSLSMEVSSQGTNWESISKNMNGRINLKGKELTLRGLDADKILKKYERSQNFNLVDLGGVLLAGPVGLVLTKGTDYAGLLTMNPGESTKIKKLVSNWDVNNGCFTLDDVAFTTEENRIAIKGSVDVAKDTLSLTVALLDENGCSKLLQGLSGKLEAPVMGKIEVFNTILAPVTNLIKDVIGIDCDPFYTGSLEHPKSE